MLFNALNVQFFYIYPVTIYIKPLHKLPITYPQIFIQIKISLKTCVHLSLFY